VAALIRQQSLASGGANQKNFIRRLVFEKDRSVAVSTEKLNDSMHQPFIKPAYCSPPALRLAAGAANPRSGVPGRLYPSGL
jgi:hypothetical protein